MMLAAMRTRSDGLVVIIVVVLVLRIQRTIVIASVVAARWRVGVLGVVRVVLCLLVGLLALASLHPGLLQQTSLLGQTFALLPVLDLVLPDEC